LTPTATPFPYTTLFRSGRHGEQVQVGEPPVAGGEQGVVDGARGALVRRSARGPYGEDERQAGPALPLFPQVVAVGVGVPRGQERSEEHTSELQSLAYLV